MFFILIRHFKETGTLGNTIYFLWALGLGSEIQTIPLTVIRDGTGLDWTGSEWVVSTILDIDTISDGVMGGMD